MCIVGQKLMDNVDPASWYMRKQGWAGASNPANIIGARINGAIGIGDGKTKTEKNAVKMGIQARDKAHAASRVTSTAGHIQTIAARKAKGE